MPARAFVVGSSWVGSDSCAFARRSALACHVVVNSMLDAAVAVTCGCAAEVLSSATELHHRSVGRPV